MNEPGLVLIVNQSVETLNLLRDVVEESGVRVVLGHRASMDDEALLEFIAKHQPDVVLFDIPWPYDENLASFRALIADETRRPTKGWVALSTSERIVDAVTATGECAILGKPFDLEHLMTMIGSQLRA